MESLLLTGLVAGAALIVGYVVGKKGLI